MNHATNLVSIRRRTIVVMEGPNGAPRHCSGLLMDEEIEHVIDLFRDQYPHMRVRYLVRCRPRMRR